MTLLGPLPCISCGKTVTWNRLLGEWHLMEGSAAHDCPGVREEPRECGAWMRNSRERCARRKGHADGHRRRAVMDDEAARRRSLRIAA
jgi:hypothetical protein